MRMKNQTCNDLQPRSPASTEQSKMLIASARRCRGSETIAAAPNLSESAQDCVTIVVMLWVL